VNHARLIVAGNPDQYTGGYLYDARIAAGLADYGWQIDTIGLPGVFPRTDAQAQSAMHTVLADSPDNSVVIIDGLALGDLADTVAAHRRRLRLIGLVHHPLADEYSLSEPQVKYFFDRETAALAAVNRIIVTSRFTAKRLADYQVAAERIDTVLPGVALAQPAPAVDQPLRAPARLLCVATLIPRKGHAVLVAALAQIADLNWRCECIGALDRDLACVAEVQQAIKTYGLADRIDLAGSRTPAALVDAYEQSDVFVLPSFYEGYGMVITEALSHGLPIVTTTGGALADTLPRQAGQAVPPGNATALAKALRAVLTDAHHHARLRQGALKARGNLGSWSTASQQFAAVLNNVEAGA